ncbi:hypothetical protein FE257_004885 [Aspergillus nanangensis]|uniref:Uncharacterized protein n=1 Tax=Aspergillus nanangensis TaxID=2582783 RepID=A0AAD4GMB8_ASPNN|nr:hypothetical protein FE257_004885 [Aspergillus nanangensis]
MCRSRLSEHIADTLEIDIKPCDVRLKTDNETPYEWHVEDPRIQELFDRQLSKHSVNAFIVLTEEVGHSFWAKTSQPTLKEQLKAVQAQNLALVERLANAETEVAGRVRDADNLEQKLRIANSTIENSRQEIQRWMSMA